MDMVRHVIEVGIKTNCTSIYCVWPTTLNELSVLSEKRNYREIASKTSIIGKKDIPIR